MIEHVVGTCFEDGSAVPQQAGFTHRFPALSMQIKQVRLRMKNLDSGSSGLYKDFTHCVPAVLDGVADQGTDFPKSTHKVCGALTWPRVAVVPILHPEVSTSPMERCS